MRFPSFVARLGATLALTTVMYGCADNVPECESSSDCVLGAETCDTDNGTCVPVILVECANDGECGSGEICTGDFECVAGCRATTDCDSGETCRNNRCESGPACVNADDCGANQRCAGGVCEDLTGLQCLKLGNACTVGAPTADGFVCKDYQNGRGAVCYAACAERTFCSNLTTTPAVAATVNECAEGSICLAGACRPSECSGPVTGQDECAAIARAEPDAYPNGALCELRTIDLLENKPGFVITSDNQTSQYVSEFDSSYQCVPAGTAGVDESCSEGTPGINGTPAVRCSEGLTCVKEFSLFNLGDQGQSFCRKACLRDDQCSPGDQCIGEDTGVFDGAGVCGDGCEPFTMGKNDCAEGNKCLAVSPEDGFCTPLVGAPGDLAAYGDCRDNGDADCPSGTICVASQCLPQCDPTLPTQAEADAQCFGGNPKTYIKVAHLAQNAGAVDVYLDNVRVLDDLAFEEIGADGDSWFAIDPGAHLIEVVAGDLETNRIVLSETTVDLAPNASTVFSALPADGAANAVQVVTYNGVRKLGALIANKSNLRIVHNVAGVAGVDVVATAADADVAVEANQVELVTGLAFGAATDYEVVDSGTFDIYVFPEGAVRLALNAAVVYEDVVLEDAAQIAAVAFGKVGGDNIRTPGLKVIPQDEFLFVPRSGGYCFDLAASNGVAPSAGWGICFQECPDGAAGYGKNACDSNGPATCSPFGTNLSVCFMGGNAEVGETCGTVDSGGGNFIEVDCVDGAFCDEAGGNTGTCRSYCTTPGEPANPDLLGCQGDEVCAPSLLVSGLGQCRLTCTPESPGVFIDRTNCPVGQQSCYPEDGTFFCHAEGGAGGVAVGDGCEDSAAFGGATECGAGALCVTDVARDSNGFEFLIQGFLDPDPLENETQTCRQMCRPFQGDGDCAEGTACLPLLPTQDFNPFAGVCIPQAQVTPGVGRDPDLCRGEDIGLMCGDGSFCTLNTEAVDADAGQCIRTGSCLDLCDKATNLGCGPNQECRALGSSEQTSLFIGTFGICRDI